MNFESPENFALKEKSIQEIEEEIRQIIKRLPKGTEKWPEEIVEKFEEQIDEKLDELEEKNLSDAQKKKKMEEIKSFLLLKIKKREELLESGFKVSQDVQSFFEKNFPQELLLESKNKILKYLEESLNVPETFLGKGKTATVHFGKNHPEFCFKAISNQEAYKEGVNVRREAGFLDELADLAVGKIRTPKPYYFLMNDKQHLLVMETLNALTLQEFMDRKIKTPRDFSWQEFFGEVERFVIEMNKRGIFHGDLHLGNIMVDKSFGGEGYVIDFGCARREIVESEHADSGYEGKNKMIFFKKDLQKLKESKTKFFNWVKMENQK